MGRGGQSLHANSRSLLFGSRVLGSGPRDLRRRDTLSWVERSSASIDEHRYQVHLELDAEQLWVVLGLARMSTRATVQLWADGIINALRLPLRPEYQDCLRAAARQQHRVFAVDLIDEYGQGVLFSVVEEWMIHDDHDDYGDLPGCLARWVQAELARLPQPSTVYQKSSQHVWRLAGSDLRLMASGLSLTKSNNDFPDGAQQLLKRLTADQLVHPGYPNLPVYLAARSIDRHCLLKLSDDEHMAARRALVAISSNVESFEQARMAAILAATE
jgi:hypothetical protein